jgi:sirohydrochlorin ferrochelatase
VAARAALARRFASVSTAFLEEEPFLEDALRTSNAPTIVAGFFFGDGMHAAEDVPDAIAETCANAVYTGAIGDSPAIARLIATALVTSSDS